MEELKIRLELEPMALGLEKLTHLEIVVSHDKGGISFGSGELRSCGVRCDVHPIELQNFHGSMVIGRVFDGATAHQGFYTHLIDCKKKSPKKMQMAFDKIKPHAEEIKELYLKEKYWEIANLLKKVVNE